MQIQGHVSDPTKRLDNLNRELHGTTLSVRLYRPLFVSDDVPHLATSNSRKLKKNHQIHNVDPEIS